MSTFFYSPVQPLLAETADGALLPLASLQVPTLAVVGSRDSAPARAVVHQLPSVAPAAPAATVDGVGH